MTDAHTHMIIDAFAVGDIPDMYASYMRYERSKIQYVTDSIRVGFNVSHDKTGLVFAAWMAEHGYTYDHIRPLIDQIVKTLCD